MISGIEEAAMSCSFKAAAVKSSLTLARLHEIKVQQLADGAAIGTHRLCATQLVPLQPPTHNIHAVPSIILLLMAQQLT
jgi:hypothetical protein